MKEQMPTMDGGEEVKFEDIKFGEPSLADKKLWAENLEVVKMLCELGTVSHWQENTSYPHVPDKFTIDGLEVAFLPHWGFYQIGKINLNTPDSPETIKKDIEAYKRLQARGLEDQTPLKK